MKYLVNKETKEHVIYVPWSMNSQWTLVEADSEGWIKHEGKVCPLPDGVRCDIIEGKWTSPDARPAKNWSWGSALRYRPILTEQAEPKTIDDLIRADHPYKDNKQAEPVQEPENIIEAIDAAMLEYDKACDDFESELSDFIMGSNELKAPDYDPRSVSFNLLDRLKAAHEHAQQIPDLEAELREVLGSMGYDLVSRNPFTQQPHGAGGE
jgi:hypothetical protein